MARRNEAMTIIGKAAAAYAAMKAHFHGNQVHGEFYKPEAGGLSFARRERRPARCQWQ
jgi:hypothetical protein